jgi:hypothetical protein
MTEQWVDFWAVFQSDPGGRLSVVDCAGTEEGAREKGLQWVRASGGRYAYSIHEAKALVLVGAPRELLCTVAVEVGA